MRRKVMLEEVILVVKLSLFPVWSWPQPQDATQFKLFCVKLHHCLCIIIKLALTLSLIYTITNHFDDPEILVNLAVLTSALIHGSFNFFFHMVNHHHIQNVTFEMVHFSGLMKPHEEVLIQRYIDKCMVYHGGSIFTFYFVTFVQIALPFLTQQSFPILTEYPFDVSCQPLFTIIYIHQSAAGILIAGQLCTNVFMALLLWFASARFEIFIEDLGKITNIRQLYKCIKIHQELLEYATEVALVARPFAFTSICCSMTSIISTFLVLVTKQPILMILQFMAMSLACITEVFMYTWAADYLIFMCQNVAQAAFNILENNHLINLTEIRKCLQIIIMRSQKPIKISIPCFLPTLSLDYFTSYLSTILSYFTTLRVMMNNDNN
ncbi:uncharacterized protein LOC143902199 isoform X1 [Temnothorax americanus]|uniref:uncharacterized protein LOC143902199 isoform X1 n=1 Tax=Temnothorax americanus TaxID=1964332 RepID=UPI0040676998